MIEDGPAGNDSAGDGQFDAIVDEVLELQRAGHHPQLTDFEQRYPEHAAELREIFSTLLLAERMDNEFSRGGRCGGENRGRDAREFPPQIGDFELLHELGRGGMGVVFAARQISLNRRVAVKLLSRHLASDPRFAERFAREARSAARLQHPHIVSVFSNGCEQGLSYYAMQLIDGKNMADVMAGVRQLLADGDSDSAGDGNDHPRRLLSATGSKGKPAATVRDPATSTLPTARTAIESDQPKTSVGKDSGNTIPSRVPATPNGTSRLSNPSGTIRREAYYKNIARLARDVAWALEYAHQQGTVHRDIKPSNLILDNSGEVWITDFGLARLDTEQPMTEAGDLLGTLRYVAPEQLDGLSAPSCDVYGVGVTLYELATLKPAWSGDNHAQIMERVRTESVVRPRFIDPSIPRDLETVILTAMARSPADRYRTAGELGDDLERFCNDQAIRARKPSPLESLLRWSRRNRLAAASIAAVLFLAAVVVPILTTAYSYQLGAEVVRSRAAEVKTSEANQSAQLNLIDSLIQQARAVRENRSISARKSCLTALVQANQIVRELGPMLGGFGGLETRILDEAIAALALPSFPEAVSLPFGPHLSENMNLLHAADQIFVRRRETNGQRFTEVLNWNNPATSFLSLAFWAQRAEINSQKTHLLTISNPDLKATDLAVWQIDSGRQVWSSRLPHFQGHFSSMGNRVIAMEESGRPVICEIATGQVRRGPIICDPDLVLPLVFCNPEGEILALLYPERIEIRSFGDGKLIQRIRPARKRTSFNNACWSPKDNWFAAKTTDGLIEVYDPITWETLRVLSADRAQGTQLSASGDGRYLETSTWTKRIELFDVVSGDRIARVSQEVGGEFLDLTDYLVGPVCDSRQARFLKLLPSKVYRAHGSTPDASLFSRDLGVSPDGRLIVCRIPEGQIALLNLQTGQQCLRPARLDAMAFDARGDLWGLGQGQFFRWRFVPDDRLIRFSDPVPVASINGSCFAIDPAGRTMVWNRNEGAAIGSLEDPVAAQTRQEWGDVRKMAVSPDGHWFVAAGHNQRGCRVFDARSQAVWDLAPEFFRSVPCFSPDGRFLALTVPGDSLRLYRCGEWDRPLKTWKPSMGQPAFSPDGRILAASFDVDGISLIRLTDYEIVHSLIHPSELTLHSQVFTNDGTRLFFTAEESNCIHEWNLAGLRRELEQLGFSATLLPADDAPGEDQLQALTASETPWIEFAPEREWVERLSQARAAGNGKAIREALEELVRIAPDNPRYSNSLARRLIENRERSTDDQARALELVRHAMKFAETDPAVLNTYGVVLLRLGEFQMAVSVLEDATNQRGDTDTSLDCYFRAIAWSRLGRTGEAAEAWWQGVKSQGRYRMLSREHFAASVESGIAVITAMTLLPR